MKEVKWLHLHFNGATFTDKAKYMPIPQREIDILGADVLIQNDGY